MPFEVDSKTVLLFCGLLLISSAGFILVVSYSLLADTPARPTAFIGGVVLLAMGAASYIKAIIEFKKSRE